MRLATQTKQLAQQQPSARKIIHIDMDSFFASVELLDNPALAGRPIAVGGRPDQRGVIATCSYQARTFGVRSAMSSAQAVKLCPQLLILPPRIDRYREVSQQLQQLYAEFSDRIEPLSLDEAYLDFSDAQLHQGSATLAAKAIRRRISEQTGLSASAGVGPNKMLAKIASDWNKPDGLFVIRPNEVAAFVVELPVSKLFGVGSVTEQKLRRMGITTCGQLQRIAANELSDRFGKFGTRLYQLCRGEDNRPVEPRRQRKSLGVEKTFSADLADFASCEAALKSLFQKLTERLERRLQGREKKITTLVLKITLSDFSRHTLQRTHPEPDWSLFRLLLQKAVSRYNLPVRLLGIAVRFGDDQFPCRQQSLLP